MFLIAKQNVFSLYKDRPVQNLKQNNLNKKIKYPPPPQIRKSKDQTSACDLSKTCALYG